MRGLAGAALDQDGVVVGDVSLDGFRNRGNTRFARGRLSGNAN